jgi:hypothetical protein
VNMGQFCIRCGYNECQWPLPVWGLSDLAPAFGVLGAAHDATLRVQELQDVAKIRKSPSWSVYCLIKENNHNKC